MQSLCRFSQATVHSPYFEKFRPHPPAVTTFRQFKRWVIELIGRVSRGWMGHCGSVDAATFTAADDGVRQNGSRQSRRAVVLQLHGV